MRYNRFEEEYQWVKWYRWHWEGIGQWIMEKISDNVIYWMKKKSLFEWMPHLKRRLYIYEYSYKQGVNSKLYNTDYI